VIITMSLLDGLLALLDRYRESERKSPDFITERPCFHPMAEAKYLATLATLRSNGALSPTEHAEQLPGSLAALRESNLSPADEEGCTWGLGFEWLDRPRTEPYLITSSLCCQALLDNHALVDVADLKALAERSVAGLAKWVTRDLIGTDSEPVPAYSPTVRAAIFNPAAHAAGTLAAAAKLGVRVPAAACDYPAAMLAVLERVRVRGVGWPYSTTRNASDLVHISYIFHAYLQLMNSIDAEEIYLEVVGQHYDGHRLFDRVRIIGQLPRRGLGQQGFKDSIVRRAGDTWYVVDSEPARLWGVGELLVTASKLAEIGRYTGYWQMIVNGIVEGFNQGELASDKRFVRFHRHTMHLAHGLAAALPHVGKETDTSGVEQFLAACSPLE
jgi:hypothetical protein